MSKYAEILAKIETLATSAYLCYSGLCKRTECLGWEAKAKSGQFGAAELKAHTGAREVYGKHLAFAEVAAMLRELSPDHVIAELQDENAALRAKVAELEKGRNGWMGCQPAPARPIIPVVPSDGKLGIGK